MTEDTNVRASMDQLVMDTLRPMTLALGVFLLWNAWAAAGSYSGAYATWPIWADVLVGGLLLSSGAAAWIWRPDSRWANHWGMAVVVLLCFTSAVAMAVRGGPGAVPDLAIVALGSGIVFLSMPWLAAAMGLVAGTWIGVTEGAGITGTSQATFVIQVAIILALAVGWGRRRAFMQLLGARDDARAAHARAAQLNEELERFAQVVTHDLQTPLTALRLKARIARMALERNEIDRAEAALLDIDRIANQSGVFVLEMLDYARSGEHKVEKSRVDIGKIVNEVADLVEAPLMAVGGRLVVSPLPVVHGDYVMLRQLMLNLVSNSIRYRRENEPLVIKIRGHADAGGAALMVEDNGQGFTPDEGNRLFKPFEMGAQGTGHGLGLALCKRIVKSHGGHIAAEGRPGEGATFTVELPHVVALGREASVSHTA